MCGCGGHGRGQDAPHPRPGLQQAVLPVAAAQHPCTHRLRHRSVQDLQGSFGAIMCGS